MILVVDDHPDLGRGIRAMLEQAGHQAAHVLSGEAALAFVRRERPRLIVLDQNMPGMSGIEVLRRLRSDQDFQDIPVIMNSAQANAAVEAEARRLGVRAFLYKGSDDWDDLPRLVERHAESPRPHSRPAAAG